MTHGRRLLVLAVMTSMPCFADETPKACDMARWTWPGHGSRLPFRDSGSLDSSRDPS